MQNVFEGFLLFFFLLLKGSDGGLTMRLVSATLKETKMKKSRGKNHCGGLLCLKMTFLLSRRRHRRLGLLVHKGQASSTYQAWIIFSFVDRFFGCLFYEFGALLFFLSTLTHAMC